MSDVLQYIVSGSHFRRQGSDLNVANTYPGCRFVSLACCSTLKIMQSKAAQLGCTRLNRCLILKHATDESCHTHLSRSFDSQKDVPRPHPRLYESDLSLVDPGYHGPIPPALLVPVLVQTL